MNSIAPAFNGPALLATISALFKVGELPKMVNGVEVANLNKPSTNSLHDLTAGLEASSPVSLPFKQVSRVQSVGAQLKHASELAGRGGRPERKFLHKRNILGVDEGVKLLVKLVEFRSAGNGMSGLVVSLVLLVLPDVNCRPTLEYHSQRGTHQLTKGIAIADLCSPASNQVDLILGRIGDLGVEISDELDVLVDLVGLDFVENDGVDVLPSSQDLTEAGLELGLHLPTLFCAVDEIG